MDDLTAIGIDYTDRAANLGAHKQVFAIRRILRKARTLIHQRILHDLIARGVDKMRHVCGLGRVDHIFAIRRNPHALRLHTHRHFGQNRVCVHIRHRDQIVILIGDEQRIARRVQHEKLRVRPRGQRVQFLIGRGIKHPHHIVIRGADIEMLAIGTCGDAARAVSGGEFGDHLPCLAIDNGDGVAAFIADKHLARQCRAGHQGKKGARKGHSVHVLSPIDQRRCRRSRVDQAQAYPRASVDAGTPLAATRSA